MRPARALEASGVPEGTEDAEDPSTGPTLSVLASLGRLGAALGDLVLPGRCAGCSLPGPQLCPECATTLALPPLLRRPEPAPPGLPPTWSATVYEGPVMAVLAAHKEEGRLGLARPLGDALAAAVLASIGAATRGAAVRGAAVAEEGMRGGRGTGVPDVRPLVLVPVPSTRASVRARGHDPTGRLARRAAATGRRELPSLRCASVLRHARVVADQAGLDTAGRAANLRGALVVPARLAVLVQGHSVIVVDDVLTTGATVQEAARALAAVGADVLAAATVAATARRGGGAK